MSMAFKCNGFLAFHYVFFFLKKEIGLKGPKKIILNKIIKWIHKIILQAQKKVPNYWVIFLIFVF